MSSPPPPRGPRAWRLAGTVLVWGLVLLTAGAGLVWIGFLRGQRAERSARLGDLGLALVQAHWFHDEEDHGGQSTSARVSRLSAAFTLSNRGPVSTRVEASEFLLVEEGGRRFRPVDLRQTGWEVPSGATLSFHLQWELSPGPAPLIVEWRRGGERARLLWSRVPAGALPSPRVPPWPRRAEALPVGDPDEGARLYFGKAACAACHGDPRLAEGGRLGPSLRGLTAVAGTRVPGASAEQYVYESLLAPDRFLAPGCADREHCPPEVAMPFYGESLTQQELAGLLAFLLPPASAPVGVAR